ncbi:MAG: hypothetical protein QOE68_1643, partial [Thermoanaerobaculia bacterium]|nr:hypothetical protein [Thermoanaerobaculia bacterium]
ADDVGTVGTKNVFFPTAASTTSSGAFKTDVRLFNPSTTTDITVQAFVLPGGNQNNGAAAPHNVNVPKRQMVVLNDAIAGFGGTDLDALRLTSSNGFVATERVYAQRAPTGSCNIGGTLGQDVPALDASAAQKSGVLLQLKNGGSFRTNIGAVNPNTTTANVVFHLYDKANALISNGPSIAIQPLGVIAPTSITSGFFFTSGTADLTDAWVSYTSDQPIFAYASVIDTGTNDPTFVPMAADTGSGTVQPSTKSFAVAVRSFVIDFNPVPGANLAIGDQLVLTITAQDPLHGFELQAPDGTILINIGALTVGQTVTRTVTVTQEGTYNYFCTNVSCGTGHASMFGQFIVGDGSYDPPPRY